MAQLDGDYTWLNSDTGVLLNGQITFTFDGVEVTKGDLTPPSAGLIRCSGWANNYCWAGLFETTDNGTGTYQMYGWDQGSGDHRQRVVLTYSSTGAVYRGSVPKNSSQPWSGTMILPADSFWDGVWFEPVPPPAVAAAPGPENRGRRAASTSSMVRGVRTFTPSADPLKSLQEAEDLQSETWDALRGL